MHWGTGSAVTSVLLARPRYGDLYIDADRGWGVGIDACSVDAVVPHENQLAVEARVAGSLDRRLTMVVKSSQPLEVLVNRQSCGVCVAGTSHLVISFVRERGTMQ